MPENETESSPVATRPRMCDLKFLVTEEQMEGFKEAARRKGFLSVAEYVRTTTWRDAVATLNAPVPGEVQASEPVESGR